MCGFRKGRSCTDAIFMVQQMIIINMVIYYKINYNKFLNNQTLPNLL